MRGRSQKRVQQADVLFASREFIRCGVSGAYLKGASKMQKAKDGFPLSLFVGIQLPSVTKGAEMPNDPTKYGLYRLIWRITKEVLGLVLLVLSVLKLILELLR